MIIRRLGNRHERRYWKVLLARFGLRGIVVRDAVLTPGGGYRVRCSVRSGFPDLKSLADQVAVHKRMPAGSIRVDETTDGFVLRGPGG